jgi:bifunctional non-homologous end joining protein LigD
MKTYRVPSDTSDQIYLVKVHEGRYWCTCPAWQFSRSDPKACKHTRRIQKDPSAGEEVKASTELSAFQKFKTKQFGFVKPMLASTPPRERLRAFEWAIEEKFDGHRLIVSVHEGKVLAWSRAGNERELAPHVKRVLEDFPSCTLDGEEVVIGGGRSYDVKNQTLRHKTRFVVFDVLRLLKRDTTHESYDQRRKFLKELFKKRLSPSVMLAESWSVAVFPNNLRYVARAVWKRDGEGVILKRRDAPYEIGKRSKHMIKIKKAQSAVLTIVGFKPSKGTKQNRGPYAIAILRDKERHETSVKVKDDDMLRRLNDATGGEHVTRHPWIGRKLRIEFQERTPDGSYREPRWDRLEDE